MKDAGEFQEVLRSMREIVDVFGNELSIKHTETGFLVETPRTDANGKGEFFASAEIKKNYVSFHLMPLYCFPDLAEHVSPTLKKRMQGKSCFNFKSVDANGFSELSEHIKTGIERYRSEGKL